MNTIIFMVAVALLLSTGFVLSYVWASANGQFDDLETPAHRMLKNDELKKITHEGNKNGNESAG